MALVLHTTPYSTNAERVALALVHKGAAPSVTVHDPADRSGLLALSGQPLAPVLVVEDGTALFDSPVVLEALERRHPDPPLLPADPAARAQVRLRCEWFNHVWKVAPNAIEGERAAAAPDADRIAGWQADMTRHADLVEDALADGRAYLDGDALTLSDVTIWPFLKHLDGARDAHPFHAIIAEAGPLDGRPHLRAWVERVAAWPPVAQAYALLGWDA